SRTNVSRKNDVKSPLERESGEITVASRAGLSLVRPVIDYLDLRSGHAFFDQAFLEARRHNDDSSGPGIDPLAQPTYDSQDITIGDHPRCGERVRPHIMYRIDERDTANRCDQGSGEPNRQGRMIDIHDIGTRRSDEAVHRQRSGEGDIVEDAAECGTAMAG